MGWEGCVADCYVRYKKSVFDCLAVNIRLIPLIVIPVLGVISTNYKGKGMRNLPYIRM